MEERENESHRLEQADTFEAKWLAVKDGTERLIQSELFKKLEGVRHNIAAH